MCRVLNISRGTYYYKVKQRESEAEIEQAIIESFHASRQNYGTRKIKQDLKDVGFTVSRRRIGRIMKKFHLVSRYTELSFKVHSMPSNKKKVANHLNREFRRESPMDVLVTDLTYV